MKILRVGIRTRRAAGGLRRLAAAWMLWTGAGPAGAEAPADLASGFDAGAEGWSLTAGGAPVWQASGGAQGGYLRGSGPNSGWYFESPVEWGGDWSQYRVLKFDLSLVNRLYADAARNNIVVIRGTNGVEVAWSGLSPEFTWTHYEAPLQAGAFQVSPEVFASVMQGVAWVRILGEYTTGAEQTGLDSVRLTAQGPASLTNDLMSTFTTGTEGWRPVDDVTLSHYTGEFAGHLGGALKGNDWMDGRVWWMATPVTWAGDWRAFQTLMFDLGVMSPGSLPAGPSPNVRIMGANGQVLEGGDIPAGGAWRHYTIALNPETFGVSASAFEEVMRHVVEMRIRGEWTSSDDVELLDNVIVTRELRFPLVDHDLTASFDADTEGWRVAGNGSATWTGSGGSPGGGYLRGADGGAGVWYFVAPESWGGDWSLVKQLRFRMKFLSGVYGGGAVDTVRIKTYDGRELVSGASLQAGSWTPYTVDLTPANFGVDRAAFDSAIRNVKEFWIRGESTATGDDISGLDFVEASLSDTPPVAPDWVSRFDGGTDGWRAWGGVGMSWQAGGGNPGGYLLGNDGGSDRWGLASPESWCGDWRQYRALSFDFRIVSGGYGFGAEDFVQILGANGQTLVSGIPAPDNSWRRHDLALEPATFNVDSNTYEAVMRTVVQVVLYAEVVSGYDGEGIDNVVLSKAPAAYAQWKNLYWNGAERDQESVSGLSADPDGDGADNWTEYVAGTAPTNRVDCLRAEIAPAPGGGWRVSFDTRLGRVYSVQGTDVMGAPGAWQDLTNGIAGTGERIWAGDPAVDGRRFYRVKTARAE